MRCFAYGSNMSLARIRARVPSAHPVAVACLPGHRLRFHKIGADGSGKCDAEATGDPADEVHGVVYEIPDEDKPQLDGCEGLGRGYHETIVKPITAQGEQSAAMYVATRIDPGRRPFRWYREHVLRGAREHGLPPNYRAAIEAVEAIDDPDRARHERELAIYT